MAKFKGAQNGQVPAHAPTGLYARSESGLRIRSERVRRIVSRMKKEMPWLQPSDTPAMKSWAELEVLSATVFAWLLRMNVINTDGEPRRLLSEHRQLKMAQLAFARELGMTPAARMAIKANGTNAALDIVGQMQAADDADGQDDES